MSGFIGAGDLYFDRFDADGASKGYLKIGNATQFSIEEPSEVKERMSRQRDTYGQVLDSVPVQGAAKLTIVLDEMSKDILAMALHGSPTPVAETGTSVTDEAITAKHDRWVKLDYEDISAVTVTHSSGDPTYVAGTDYEVDTDLGMIKALSTGSITDDQALLADYTYGSVNYSLIEGQATPIVRGAFMLHGKNLVTGKDCRLTCYQATVQSTDPVDFLNEDFETIQFECTLETPSGMSKAYDVRYYE